MKPTVRYRVRLVLVDILELDMDVIATAANEAICGGGDGAVWAPIFWPNARASDRIRQANPGL